jgi:hypothetical protein
VAGIDKTYVTCWEDYVEVKDWALQVGVVRDDFGNIFSPIDWLPEYEETNFTGRRELVLWNTPTYFDVWLIRYCPIDFIQGRLKQQYGSSYIEIKERRSEYDHYVRPAASSHFKVLPLSSFPRIRARNLWLYIQSESSDWMYDDETGEWHHWLECRQWNTNTMDAKGPITRRKLKRIISKCGFPAGVKLRVCSNYGHVFEVVIKK